MIITKAKWGKDVDLHSVPSCALHTLIVLSWLAEYTKPINKNLRIVFLTISRNLYNIFKHAFFGDRLELF